MESTKQLATPTLRTGTDFPHQPFIWDPKSLDAETVARRQDLDRWSVRVRGVPEGVLSSWDSTHYWNGEVILRLSQIAGRHNLEPMKQPSDSPRDK